MQQNSKAKEAAAIKAVDYVEDGMLVGLGTGSTTIFFIKKLSEKVKAGLRVDCAASSVKSWNLGFSSGLSMLDMQNVTRLDLTVDGADEIDGRKNMLKGGGGALLREKILASISGEMVVVVDSSKVVQKLGSFPMAIEIVDFGLNATIGQIGQLGLNPLLRCENHCPFVTDGGNRIVDVDVSHLEMPMHELEKELLQIPGVITTGFFQGLAGRVLIGRQDGSVEVWKEGRRDV